ncbi:hypothetical protein PAXRUDRAFT_831333 [Paxillus rubicundulus Ve08.2h10]|uniref:Uncharacterized protein n=1 Tax=Paxillus rubicundulus Ve08.2h10 TaxID=930991 RepID=A0A0D0DII2_9AGAM|nr:hypothetical protein PAXRUDRAFT_831333 [Paxillus rubicundulus Ve08.2h10]
MTALLWLLDRRFAEGSLTRKLIICNSTYYEPWADSGAPMAEAEVRGPPQEHSWLPWLGPENFRRLNFFVISFDKYFLPPV